MHKNIVKYILSIFLLIFPSFVYSLELGFSASGKAISVDFLSQYNEIKEFGLYGRVIWDFEVYENGTTVNVCLDGSISGSSGSGTCSGHGGVSHKKPAEFSRYGLIIGSIYWMTNSIRLHGGIIMGVYNSDIDIGEKDKLDFTKYGVDMGISYSPFAVDGVRLMLSYETEQEQTFLGLSFPI